MSTLCIKRMIIDVIRTHSALGIMLRTSHTWCCLRHNFETVIFFRSRNRGIFPKARCLESCKAKIQIYVCASQKPILLTLTLYFFMLPFSHLQKKGNTICPAHLTK